MNHYRLILFLLTFNLYFSQNENISYTASSIEKLDLLISQISSSDSVFINKNLYEKLILKLDSLGIKDEQLIDGYDWGGGQAGFESYLNKNVDRLLSYFKVAEIDSSNVDDTVDSMKVEEDFILIEEKVKPVEDLILKNSSDKKVQISQLENSKKSILSGLRIGGSLGKSLIKGTSLSNHVTFFESVFSVRSPIGINIGPFMTRVGYERSGYSFESPDGTSENYFGFGSGIVFNIDLSKIIKIGGPNIIKEFIIGKQGYDHGSGFAAGYNLNLLFGKLPFSISISSRLNTINFTDGSGSSYYGSLSAGLGLDLK